MKEGVNKIAVTDGLFQLEKNIKEGRNIVFPTLRNLSNLLSAKMETFFQAVKSDLWKGSI